MTKRGKRRFVIFLCAAAVILVTAGIVRVKLHPPRPPRPLHEQIADYMYHSRTDPKLEYLVEKYGDEFVATEYGSIQSTRFSDFYVNVEWYEEEKNYKDDYIVYLRKQELESILIPIAEPIFGKEINHGNLITLADFYGVSVDYLLCRTENREQINTPLTELHLNDEMVALLKSGRINNRLLCELATHKDFIKFLADIEIYVDGIATMQIQNLNSLVDTVRHEIIERYRPGEDDPHLKVLQAAHISDDEYFSHMVLDDLNLIIRDIREFHKKDSESAPQTTVADELKENLEAVENFKGSRDEKLVILYCKQLGINYKNLSEEEFRWFIRILKKSKKMGTPISQRKKR